MKKQFVQPHHAMKKTEICSVVLKKVISTSGVALTLVVESASAIRELAVHTHTNSWFLMTERIPRKIGRFLKKMHLRRFFFDPKQSCKVLGVYDPTDERRLNIVERQIRRFKTALENCRFGQAFLPQSV